MIEFRNVSMSYNTGIEALKNVSFKVQDGEFVFIIGLSGSGKSTLIKLLTCEENPSKGKVYIDDYEISFLRRSLIPYLRRNIGMVFQDFRLIYSKTVYENVAFAMEIIGASHSLIKRRVPIVLSIVGLRDKASMKANQLSGGEQQRVSIARAMVNNPMLILADEPTGNLDPVNSESIMALLEEINCSGTTVIVCTHESSIVNKMRRRVIEISDGSLVRDELLGEYNLVTSKEKQKETEIHNKKATSKLPENHERKHSGKPVPFIRNINIKFSEEEKINFTENDVVKSDIVEIDITEIDITENEITESMNTITKKIIPSKTKEDVESKTVSNEEEILATVSNYYKKEMQNYKNSKSGNSRSDLKTLSNDEIPTTNPKAEELTAIAEIEDRDVDFKNIIKAKRINEKYSPEDLL